MKGTDPENPNKEEQGQDTEEEKQPPKFICAGCKSLVAFVSDIIQVGDIPVLSAQINPHGYVHEVITVCYAVNVLLYGSPVPADSWFPGYLWRYLICKTCHSHLGWSYHRPQEMKMTFAGLRRGSVLETDGST